jgi:hypothetical protein
MGQYLTQDPRGGVLLLSHVGFSFMEDLIDTLAARNLKSFVLTSRPLPEHSPGRVHELRAKADHVRETDTHVLTADDVSAYLDELRHAGVRVWCCVSVWEAYRHLMAAANVQLGVPDLAPEQVLRLRDKLAVRNRLADSGLSRVRATQLTPASLLAHQDSPGRWFIKPVSGIASYGAFALMPQHTWAAIEDIIAGAREDTVYAAAFGDGLTFLIEDYLPGQEFCFEVVGLDGEAHVVAIHEKCEVTETGGTVLENAVTSPPVSLSAGECADGIRWVRAVLDELGASWGCFHVEARYHGNHWDLIEINPRVGGSLISPSVQALNGEWSLLGLWLDALLAVAGSHPDVERVGARLRAISFTADGSTPVRNATFFRVFFAEPGCISHVGLAGDLPLPPVVSQILLKAGDCIEISSREVFLGQLLWRFPLAEQDAWLAKLSRASESAIDIRYARAKGAIGQNPPNQMLPTYPSSSEPD